MHRAKIFYTLLRAILPPYIPAHAKIAGLVNRRLHLTHAFCINSGSVVHPSDAQRTAASGLDQIRVVTLAIRPGRENLAALGRHGHHVLPLRGQ